MKITLCPICGDAPIIDKEPLWKQYGNSTHGYYGNYEHTIKCSNKSCPMSQIKFESDDIYRKPEEAIEKIKNSWNDKCKNIISLLKNNGWRN